MDQLIPTMYDQWCDPEIHFDDIVNESFYQHVSNNSKTEQSNEFDTCSIMNTYEIVYDGINNDYDDVDNEIAMATATENAYFEYNLSTNSSYEFMPYFDTMQQKSMATSLSPLVWHSNGAADSTINNGCHSSSSLSGDAIPFIPASQLKTNRKSILTLHCSFKFHIYHLVI